MADQMKEMKERIARMSDDELINMVEVEFADYRKDAIDLAKAEMTARGLDAEDEPNEVDEESPEAAEDLGPDLSSYSYEAIQRARGLLAQKDRELARAAYEIQKKQSGEEPD